MAKGTRFGRKSQEEAWQNAEVDALYRLAAAGVRVPTPYNFHEGVLLMELVADEHGEAAPRLNDVDFTPAMARAQHQSRCKPPRWWQVCNLTSPVRMPLVFVLRSNAATTST